MATNVREHVAERCSKEQERLVTGERQASVCYTHPQTDQELSSAAAAEPGFPLSWLQKIPGHSRAKLIFQDFARTCLQCFDVVGWVAGRASSL